MHEFLHQYLEVMGNPGHTAAESTFFLGELLVGKVAYNRLKRHFHRDLRKRDNRHGHQE